MSAADPLADHLTRQCQRILAGELALTASATPEHVHDTRVGVRRLRSTIRLFAQLLSVDAAELRDVDDDLRRLAGLLSEVRDVDVLDRRLRRQLADLPPELVMGPVAEEVDVALAERRAAAIDRWRRARTQEGYQAVLRTVARWSAGPPVVDGLTRARLRKKGRRVLRGATRKAERRARRAGDDPVAVHRARKAAKRQRYAADLLRPVLPEAKRTAKRAKKMQQRLGRHQDLVVEIAFLRQQAARFGGQEGHNGFTYGQLRGAAEAEAARLRRSL